MKFQAPAGQEFWVKLRESVRKTEDGGFELALAAGEAGVDNLLAQKLPPAFIRFRLGE